MGVGGHEGRFCRNPFPACSAGGRREQYRQKQGRPLFDVVRPAVLLPATASLRRSD